MTPEQRQELINRPFPILTVYRGKIWGGVQVVDKFMRTSAGEENTPTQGIYTGPDYGYAGGYADSAEDELLKVEADGFLSDAELAWMTTMPQEECR